MSTNEPNESGNVREKEAPCVLGVTALSGVFNLTVPEGVTVTIPSIHIRTPEGMDWRQVLSNSGLDCVFRFSQESCGTVNIGSVVITSDEAKNEQS